MVAPSISPPEHALPPRTLGRRHLLDGAGKTIGDARRHGGLARIVAQHFFHRGKFAGGRLLGFDFGKLCLLLGRKFGFVFHLSDTG